MGARPAPVFASALDDRHVTTVPHSRTAELAEARQRAWDPRQQAELVQEAACLEHKQQPGKAIAATICCMYADQP